MRSTRPSRLLFAAALCSSLAVPSLARADAFSPIPTGDPIYRQLDALSIMDDGKPIKAASNLTRYEAALQVARAAAIGGARPEALSRTGWRNLRDLTLALKTELVQLGVDVNDILATCSRQMNTPTKSVLPEPTPTRLGGGKNRSGTAVGTTSFLNGPVSPAISGMQRSSVGTNLPLPLFGRVRTEAAVLALKRDMQDPFGSNDLGTRSSKTQFAGKDASVGVNFNSWLRVQALASQRQLNMGPDQAPAFSAPLFNRATEAQGFGGGLEVAPMSWLHLSTDVEHLSTDAGQKGMRVGGGIGLSAWQNHLTVSAHMSRLQPEDSTLLAATATELNLGVNVSQRLNLSLLYQNLFSGQSETSRLAGGLNFSF